jgi:phosphoglycolate phosphatase
MLQMSLKAIIFDLDGTLIDSAPDLGTACNKVLAKYARRPISRSETMQFVGNGAAKLIERAFQATGTALSETDIITRTDEFLDFYRGHEADETRLYDKVETTLHRLKQDGWRLALCTNKPAEPTRNLLRDLNLSGFFEVVVGGDELDGKKPDPQMLYYVLEKMNLTVDDAIMVGDSPNDINAARNANMRNIAVSYGYRKVTLEELSADIVIHQFDEITEALNSDPS